MGHLDGQAAVVTGTAQGIGREIADLLEAEGAIVHRVDKDSVDLRDSAAVDAFFAALGELHILVNDAGGVQGQTHTPIDELTDAAWDAVVDANLRTAFNCTRAAARIMKPSRYGRIVNISSGAGRSVSLTGIQAYTSAKAAQIGFTRQMAHELGQYGITVNCIAPGFVLSNPTTQAQWDSYGEEGQRADDLHRRRAFALLGKDMTDTETAAAAELTRLGEAYFVTQHSYDPYNA